MLLKKPQGIEREDKFMSNRVQDTKRNMGEKREKEKNKK